MSLSLGTSSFIFEPCTWQPEVHAKLDTHHIAAVTNDLRARTRFAANFQRFLATQPFTEVCILHGRSILDLEGLCAQLERLIPVDELARTIDGPKGVASILRSRSIAPGHAPIRNRYFIFHDADVLARLNPVLFGRIVEVFAGVAAELEYASAESSVIQRCLYIGGEALEAEARRHDSRLHTWADDGPGIPFWSLVTGLDHPSTSICSIDALLDKHIA